MKISKVDILTPANVVSVAGLVCTVIGASSFNTLGGVIMAAVGRALDLLDGPIARRTHASLLGAKIDATFDKLCILVLLVAILHYGLAPLYVVAYILIQNGVVASLGILASKRRVHMHSSRAGKNNVFLQSIALLLFAASARFDGTLHTALLLGSYAILAVSLYFAVTAVIGYAKVATAAKHRA